MTKTDRISDINDILNSIPNAMTYRCQRHNGRWEAEISVHMGPGRTLYFRGYGRNPDDALRHAAKEATEAQRKVEQ